MTDRYIVVETVKCETADDLFGELYRMCEQDPRGQDVGMATAVAIDNSYVGIELRQFEDGTRTFVLKAV